MKKLLITDLDDTLYNWMNFFVPSFYGMLDEILAITGLDRQTVLDEYREKHRFYGSVEHPYTTLALPSLREKYSNLSDEALKALLAPAFDIFNRMRKERLRLFDGVEDTLRTLAAQGVTIIGYTESMQVNGFYRLKMLGIDGYFKHVYTFRGQYVSGYPDDEKVLTVSTKKPDPQVLLNICAKEACAPEDTVYVGDSLAKDVGMAHTAGITSVWAHYPREDHGDEARLEAITSWTEEDFARAAAAQAMLEKKSLVPDYTIPCFSQVLDIVQGNI